MAFTFSRSAKVKISKTSRSIIKQVPILTSKRTHSKKVSSLKIYYGSGELEKLKTYNHAAIQPAYYSTCEIDALKASGVSPLAYISLGEDPKDYFDVDQPYRRNRMNVDWQTHYVYVNSQEWQDKIQGLVQDYINQGFQGFLLDSLDVVDLFPEERQGMLKLVNYISQQLSQLAKQTKVNTYLIANRGFALLPEMAPMIDACLFEGFSTKWAQQGTTEAMSQEDLKWSAMKARALEEYKLDRYSLDYCIGENSDQLEHFSVARANYYGLAPLISNRALTEI